MAAEHYRIFLYFVYFSFKEMPTITQHNPDMKKFSLLEGNRINLCLDEVINLGEKEFQQLLILHQ